MSHVTPPYLDDDIHADESDYLYIAESGISDAGLGLFTAIPIYKDEVIAIYHGETLDAEEIAKRIQENQDKYFINLPQGGVYDCGQTDGFAKYANDADGLQKSNFTNNAKIAFNENHQICLIALRNIKAMQEIFCSYGKSYWRGYTNE